MLLRKFKVVTGNFLAELQMNQLAFDQAGTLKSERQQGVIMAKKEIQKLRKLSIREVTIFRIANRKGFAAIARNNLTEGRSAYQAYSRLVKACRRNGYELPIKKAPDLSGVK